MEKYNKLKKIDCVMIRVEDVKAAMHSGYDEGTTQARTSITISFFSLKSIIGSR